MRVRNQLIIVLLIMQPTIVLLWMELTAAIFLGSKEEVETHYAIQSMEKIA